MSHLATLRIKHLTHAVNGEKLTPSQKGVLMQMADDHNEDRGYCWPSIPQLAIRAGLSEKQCRRIVQKLVATKTIESRPRLRDGSEARTSSEYRFWFDKPFDAASTARTEKRLRLQAMRTAQRPVQMHLNPPPAHGRGALPPKGVPPSHRRESPPPTHGSPPLPPVGGLELPIELQGEPVSEPRLEQPTLPSQGRVKVSRVDIERWDHFRQLLQSELVSIPGNLAAAKGFSEVLPGQNDYDTCFRGWWLEEVRRTADELVLVTMAEDEDATEAGIKKYGSRLERLARPRFQIGPTPLPIRFEVMRSAGAQTAKTVVPAASQKLGRDLDVWTRVKAQIADALGQIADKTERAEARKNFREAIEPTRLASIEMDGTAPVWKLISPNAKKTRAVLGLLRKFVHPAMQMHAGNEVQVMVIEHTGQ